jgi:hypothetical protein
VDLAAQKREYARRTAEEAAEKAEAQRESIEKEQMFGAAADKIKIAKEKANQIEKYGKSKRQLELNLAQEEEEEKKKAAAAAAAAEENNPRRSPLRLSPLKLPSLPAFLSPKHKDKRPVPKALAFDDAEGGVGVGLEGESGDRAGGAATAGATIEGDEAIPEIDLETGLPIPAAEPEPAAPAEVKPSLLFQFGYFVFLGIKLILKGLELPLLRFVPPYKKWKMARMARDLMRENTGASALSQELGMDNEFKTSPLTFVIRRTYQFVQEKVARVYVFFYAIYMEIMRIIYKYDKVYTIEDLEGGAYDGDNGLVVRCFAQKLKKGMKPLQVDGRTPDGKTPLMCCFEGLLKADEGELERQLQLKEKAAISRGLTNIFSFGAKVMGVSQDPVTRYSKTIATLLGMGADISVQQDVRSSDGSGLLHLAARAGNVERAVWLLTRGCNVDMGAILNRQTPLHHACKSGQAQVAMLFMTKGAEIDKRDSSGRTPLHFAASHGGTHMTRVMLLSGAKKSIWDDSGKTPFDHARSCGNRSSVEALLVFRAPVMSSKQSINFLFAKMLAEGEHQYKAERKDDAFSVANNAVQDTQVAARQASAGLFRRGANLIRNGVRIADSTMANDAVAESDADRAVRERRERRERKSRQSRGEPSPRQDEPEEVEVSAAKKSFIGAVRKIGMTFNLKKGGSSGGEQGDIAEEAAKTAAVPEGSSASVPPAEESLSDILAAAKKEAMEEVQSTGVKFAADENV